VSSASVYLPVFRLIRSGWLVGVLLIWAALLLLPLFYFTVYPTREQYLSLSREIGWKTGFFQGTRGRIVDREGTPLAWTERQFDLQLNRKLTYERRKAVLDILAVVFLERTPPLPEAPGLIKRNLDPAELHRFAAVSNQAPELELSSRQLRMLARPELERFVGKVEDRHNVIAGNSGWEQQFDRRLRGKIGFFTVMTDRNGRWVPDTWKLLKMPVSGEDVMVDSTIDELLEKAQRRASL